MKNELINEKFPTISPEDEISSVFGKVKETESIDFPVVKGKEVKGVLRGFDIIEVRQPHQTKVKSVTFNPPKIKVEDEIKEVGKRLRENYLFGLPVVDEDDKYKGIVTVFSILEEIKDDPILSKTKVSDVSKEVPVIGNEEEPLEKINQKIRKLHATSVALYDGEEFTGIADLREIISKIPTSEKVGGSFNTSNFIREGLTPEKIPRFSSIASLVREKNVPYVEENETIKNAIQKMVDEKTSSLFIEGEREPKGYLSVFNILENYFERKEPKKFKQVQFSGLKKINAFEQIITYRMVKDFTQKVSKYTDLIDLQVVIDILKKKGTRQKYSVHAKAQTNLGFFHVEKSDWDMINVFGEVFKILEKQIRKKKEKKEDYHKSRNP